METRLYLTAHKRYFIPVDTHTHTLTQGWNLERVSSKSWFSCQALHITVVVTDDPPLKNTHIPKYIHSRHMMSEAVMERWCVVHMCHVWMTEGKEGKMVKKAEEEMEKDKGSPESDMSSQYGASNS